MVCHRAVCNLFCRYFVVAMNKVVAIIFISLICLVAGCGTAHKSTPGTESGISAGQELQCEAFLFDARITCEKKYNSFRLELYQTDSLIGLTGRGYLGKGALKGWITPESLLVYFPTVKEYIQEAVSDVWKSFECVQNENSLNIFGLITNLPEEIIPAEGYQLELIKDDDKEKEYQINKIGCHWSITASYDLREKGWRLKEFNISESDKFELAGKRREYRDDVKIKTNRFKPLVGPDAVRVIL